MPNDIPSTLLRTVFAFILLLAVTRMVGRKAISQMTFFDFAVAITFGSVTASLAQSAANSIYSAATALITLGLMAIITDYIHTRSVRFSKLVESEPVVLISNGKINEHNMKKTRFTVEDLATLLREKNVFNIADVEFAIMENDGKLSVLPKAQKQPATPSDLNISTPYKGLTRDVVKDGRVLIENLRDANLDEEWLKGRLKSQGVEDVKDVFYAGLDTSGNLYVSRKSKFTEKHGKYGIE